MTVYEKLLKDIPPLPIEEILVGVYSVLVKTAKSTGIASTVKYGKMHSSIGKVKQLEQKNLREIAELVYSENLIAASLGMAAINCYWAGHEQNDTPINGKEIIRERGREKTVGVIGHFPFVEIDRDVYKKLLIFEKFPQKGDLEEKDIPMYLPQADVVALTATTLTNHTFHDVIQHMSPDSYKIILGPSTPLSQVLFDYGFHAVCGTRIRDYDHVRKQVALATPIRYLEGVEFVGILNEK